MPAGAAAVVRVCDCRWRGRDVYRPTVPVAAAVMGFAAPALGVGWKGTVINPGFGHRELDVRPQWIGRRRAMVDSGGGAPGQ